MHTNQNTYKQPVLDVGGILDIIDAFQHERWAYLCCLLRSFWPNSRKHVHIYSNLQRQSNQKTFTFIETWQFKATKTKEAISDVTVFTTYWITCIGLVSMLFNLTPTIHYIFKSLGSMVPTDFDRTEKYYGNQWGLLNVWLHTFFKIYSLVFRKEKVWNNLRFNKLWQLLVELSFDHKCLIIRYVSWAANQHIRMISEESSDTEDWCNDWKFITF